MVETPLFLFQAETGSPPPVPETPDDAKRVNWTKTIEQGRMAFEKSCTECHDADEALEKSKSFQQWMVTIREMSKKEDADIPQDNFVPIATYLAVKAQAPEKPTKGQSSGSDDEPKETPGVEAGRLAFEASCLDCHDAERSLTAKKTYAEWMITIREMAGKEDADIEPGSFAPIANYLAGRSDEEIEAAKAESGGENADAEDQEDDAAGEGAGGKPTAAMIREGETAFYNSCVECHDAERSLSVAKSFSEWMSTIRRMAQKEDANIPANQFRAIASFLSDRTTDEIAEAKAKSDKEGEQDDDSGEANSGQSFDPALVSAGQAAFYRSCVKCHDAERSLSKKKGLNAWLSTVRRMAAKDGADVPASDFESIATFLAAQNSTGDGGGGDGGAEVSPWAFSTTLSTLNRSSSDPIENPDFFVDAWVGADWQSDGPLRATIMACTSCHSDRNPSKGFTLELVEASATVDLKQLFVDIHTEGFLSKRRSSHRRRIGHSGGKFGLSASAAPADVTNDSPLSTSADMKMGRFVVPFGAFSAVSHPGSYRTVTNPLMYNMGRRITTGGAFQPVLPAPYSDEGVNFHFGLREYCNRSYTLDIYAVNGLQGNVGGTNFNLSRSYTDNNATPAVGGRFTLGNQSFSTRRVWDDRANAGRRQCAAGLPPGWCGCHS